MQICVFNLVLELVVVEGISGHKRDYQYQL